MNPVTHACPVGKAAELLSDTWTMLIMHELLQGPKRFCELERDLEGISTRTLTNKLRTLLEDGMLQKDESGRYACTEKGAGLKRVLEAMRAYGDAYLK